MAYSGVSCVKSALQRHWNDSRSFKKPLKFTSFESCHHCQCQTAIRWRDQLSNESSNQRKCVAIDRRNISSGLKKEENVNERKLRTSLSNSTIGLVARKSKKAKSRERTELCHCCLPSSWPMSRSVETFNRRHRRLGVSASYDDEVTASLHGSATLIPRIATNFTKTARPFAKLKRCETFLIFLFGQSLRSGVAEVM